MLTNLYYSLISNGLFSSEEPPVGTEKMGLEMEWWLILLIIVVVIILVWAALAYFTRFSGEASGEGDHEDHSRHEEAIVVEEPVVEEPEPVVEVVPEPEPVVEAVIEPDDLKKIEGIGPKISSLLAEAGVLTFSKLSEMEPTVIKKILTDAGLRLGDPTTWPQQAKLAADGEWEALEKLQDELSGGRAK